MILVSGGTGMLGAHLLYALVQKDKKVRAIKRSTSNMEIVKRIFGYYNDDAEKLFNQIEWIEADVLDSESVFNAMQGIDYVYHAAAIVSFASKDRENMITSNIMGTQNMVNASLANGIKKFCHVSSISALGEAINGEPITEESFRNPKARHSGYSTSKFLSEMEVWRGITEGLNAVIVNPSIILGPGDWKSGSPSIFSNIGKGLKFYTNGTTGYVDVMDVVNSMISLMESDIINERFIISAENLSFKEIFWQVAEALDVKKPDTQANALMLSLAWRWESLRSKITGKVPLVTKDSAYSAVNKAKFSSEKLVNATKFKFTPINECITRIARAYKSERKES